MLEPKEVETLDVNNNTPTPSPSPTKRSTLKPAPLSERRASYGSLTLPPGKPLVPTPPIVSSDDSFDFPSSTRSHIDSEGEASFDDSERIVDLDESESTKEEEISPRDPATQLLKDEGPRCLCWKAPRWMRCLWWQRGSWSFVIVTHFGPSLYEQSRAVLPLCAYLLLFQWLILKDPIDDIGIIAGGIVAVVSGLFFFVNGLEHGLMPIGEDIGLSLGSKLPRWVVLILACVLGIGCTLAEPAIGALQTIGQIVKRDSAPYLYLILNEYSYGLVAAVGSGAGCAVVLGSLRVIYGWRLRYLILASLIPTLALSATLTYIPDLLPVVGLAWDCGAATTGPVTVPVILAIGTGLGNANGQTSPFAGFGIATLASLWPVMMVQIFGLLVWWMYPKHHIKEIPPASQLWYEKPGLLEFLMTLRAILPLLFFLLTIQALILRDPLSRVTLDRLWGKRKSYQRLKAHSDLAERISQTNLLFVGVAFAAIGLFVFNFGLSLALQRMGADVGTLISKLFLSINGKPPLYEYTWGLLICVAFVLFLGVGSTISEPSISIIGSTVEKLSNGQFSKSLLLWTCCAGIGIGSAVGVLKIVFSVKFFYILGPLYLVASILTFISTDELINVAWDTSAVTTGAVTVPLVLALGLSLGNAVETREGFGILGMASVMPIIVILTAGLIVRSSCCRCYVAENATGIEKVTLVVEEK